MLQILEKYQQYEELLNNKNNKKSNKKKKKVKSKKQTKQKSQKSQKKFSIKKIVLWGFIGLIGASVVMTIFDDGKNNTKKENKQTQKQQKQIKSTQISYPVMNSPVKDKNNNNNNNNNVNLLAGNDLKTEKELPKKTPKVVTKKITQYFCKSVVPFKSELVYYIKLDNKLVPAYSLDTWDGKGILFLPNETKKVISVIKFDNQTFYEIEKNKYILPDDKSVKCFKRVKEINETI